MVRQLLMGWATMNGFLLVNHIESRTFVYETFEWEQNQMYHVPAHIEMNPFQNVPPQFSGLQTWSSQTQIFALQNFLLRQHTPQQNNSFPSGGTIYTPQPLPQRMLQQSILPQLRQEVRSHPNFVPRSYSIPSDVLESVNPTSVSTRQWTWLSLKLLTLVATPQLKQRCHASPKDPSAACTYLLNQLDKPARLEIDLVYDDHEDNELDLDLKL